MVITFADIIAEDNEVMSPRTPGSVPKQAGSSTPIEGDLAKYKGDKDGHIFRVMRILGKCANVCCVEHTNIDFLEKVND